MTAGGSLSQDAHVSLSIRDATFASIGGVPPALAVSRNAHLLAAFDDTVSENVSFEAVVPPFYNAGASLRVDIDWVAATAVAGDVEWEVSFERVAPGGQDIDADGFAAAKTVVDTTDPTSGVVTRSTITFTNAEADSVTPGDDFRLRIVRDTAVGGNMVGDAQILAVQVTEV